MTGTAETEPYLGRDAASAPEHPGLARIAQRITRKRPVRPKGPTTFLTGLDIPERLGLRAREDGWFIVLAARHAAGPMGQLVA